MVTSSYVTSPSFAAVVGECQRTYDEVHRQRDAHLECTKRQVSSCEVGLRSALEAETRRAHRVGDANDALVARAEERSQLCAQRRLQALQSVQQLQVANIALEWNSLECSPAEVARAQELVGDVSEARTHAMDVAARYAQNVQLLHSMSLDSIDARMRYDDEYVRSKRSRLRSVPEELGAVSRAQSERMRRTLGRLNASMLPCASAPSPGGGGSHGTCALPLEPQVEQMRAQYDVLLTALREQRRSLREFHEEMEAMVSAMRPPLQAIRTVAAQIDPSIHLPSLAIPELHPPEVTLPPLPSADDLRAELRRYQAERQAAAQGYLTEASAATDAWERGLSTSTASVPSLLSDYSPPRFNTSSARSSLDAQSDEFLKEQLRALAAFSSLGVANGSAPPSAGANTSLALPDAALGQAAGLRFEPLATATVDLEQLTLSMAHVAWVATACDLVWRGWRSVRLVFLYWSKASVGLPALDMREQPGADGGLTAALAALGSAPHRALAACCMSPVSAGALLAAGLFLLANAVAALYVPTYLAYVDGCIEPPRNGTFVSQNLFSVSFNYAATEGNDVLLRGLDAYHAARGTNCTAEVRETLRRQHDAEGALRAAQQRYAASAASVRLLRRCLRADTLDAAAAAAAVQPYLPLRPVLADDACATKLAGEAAGEAAALGSGVYNCSALPECVSVCDGPSREVTAFFCQRCGCHGEWLGHGLALHVLLALFVFAGLNAGRVVFVDAVCRLLWRELFAGQFEFVANCDDVGNTAITRKQLVEALRVAVRAHRRSGWLMLLGAGALNLPWLLALRYVGSHLEIGVPE